MALPRRLDIKVMFKISPLSIIPALILFKTSLPPTFVETLGKIVTTYFISFEYKWDASEASTL